jgi:hypothetical protein
MVIKKLFYYLSISNTINYGIKRRKSRLVQPKL